MKETTICLDEKNEAGKNGRRPHRAAVSAQPARREAHRLRREQEKPAVQAAIPAWTEEAPPQEAPETGAQGREGFWHHLRAEEGSESPFIILWEVLSTEYRRPGAAGATSCGRRRPSDFPSPTAAAGNAAVFLEPGAMAADF
jgi:hypothetical protein